MNLLSSIRGGLLLTSACAILAACTQGSSISSPGATNPGTGVGGGTGGGGGGGGTGTATCPTGFTTGTSVGGLTVCNISGQILTNLTLSAVDGIAYRLNGRVDVGVDIGADGNKTGGTRANLTIEPGVTVYGASGADYIVVNRGSQLIADGEVSAPIVFTSQADIERRADSDPSNDLGGELTSEWGGIVLLGRAPINRCASAGATPGTASCENAVEGVTNPDALYGGALANDRSGKLEYVQVRFAGFAINTAGNELNGITFGGIGSETEVDFVQVHNNEDDGVEFFGGNVNVKHLVLTGNKDDSIDTDNGYQGNIQFAIVAQNPNIGDNIVEASSVGAGTAPLSDATIANFTFVGNRSNAFRLNTGTIGQYINGVVDYGKECFRWEGSAGDAVAGFAAQFDPNFNSVLFDCDLGLTRSGSDVAAAQGAVANDANNEVGPSSLASRFFPGPLEGNVQAFDLASLGGSFFTPTDYIGAFGPTETETNNWASGWTFALFADPTCPVGTVDSGTVINGQTVCDVTGIITADTRLTRGNLYRLNGRVDVGIDVGADGAAVGGDPANLTIESGVTVFGNSGADYVVVNRGSKLFSNGTRANPVIFTSQPDLLNPNRDDANNTSEWGGIVLLGRAPINRCNVPGATPGTVGCQNVVEGVTNPDALYGGAIADDNSGSITFTQVKFAGFAINTAGNELNGITFGGIGSGTNVSHVQVHNNEDDGVEFFGGRVNVKHLVLTGNKDDSIDTDNGYQGKIQFAIVVQNSTIGDNIVEASSVGAGTAPLSNATISNFTFVGNRSNAFRLNSGTVGTYINGVVDYGKECFRWESSAGNAVAGYQAGEDPAFRSVLFDCDLGLTRSGSDVAAADGAVAADANNSTNIVATLAATFVNGGAEAGVVAVDPATIDPTFFDSVNYIGAVRDSNDRWWADWSCGLEASDRC